MFTTPSRICATRTGIALCALFIGVQPTLGQFDDYGGSGSMFADVKLDGPRELAQNAPAVIDEANYVPPALQKQLTWEADEISLSAFADELSDRIGIPVLVDEIAMTDG